MAKKPRQEFHWAQHFLQSEKLVRELVAISSIGPEDIVYEIGAGRGIVTAELARIARRVVALEIDPELACVLRNRFRAAVNVDVVEDDFLAYRFTDREYAVFGNIPYNRSADIVRKILQARPAPREACLIMQREAAEKFSGCPKETRSAVLAKPWFEMEVVRSLRRWDFHPAPRVDSALLCIRKRSPPLLAGEDGSLYRRFVAFGFGEWKRSLKLTFRGIFSYRQWKHLSRDLHFRLDATPSELTFEQWMGVFSGFKNKVEHQRQTAVRERGKTYLRT
jgi:23S rRNA (adenine-N6)-dimethyltransferase